MHNVPTHLNTGLRGLGGCVGQFSAPYSQGSTASKATKKYKPIDQDLFTNLEAATLTRINERGQANFRADTVIGASFDERPLKKVLVLYSFYDVVMMPKLYLVYTKA